MVQITFTERNRGDDERHGTLAGARRHSERGESPCDACRAAKAEYDLRFNSAPERARKNRLHARAQSRALTALKRSHPAEYRELYVKAKAEIASEEIRAANEKDGG